MSLSALIYMNQITENLYLGNFFSAKFADKLKELGIKKVLSIMGGFNPNYDESYKIIHKSFNVNDIINQNIIQYFGECLNFIKGEEKILVHCAAGVSRSATIVIAYIMWDKKLSYEDALNFVESKRNVNPNPGFVEQLKIFEKELIKNDYNIDKINFDKIDLPLFHDMNLIIENLYLGNIFSVENVDKLKKIGITKVLSMIDGFNHICNGLNNIKHKTFNVIDINQQNIIQYFGECLNFIKGDEKILVHCVAGRSRSATIVIAYIMWYRKISYEDAFNFVKERRTIVEPNDGFKEQLQLFEKELIKNEYNIDKIKFDEIKWEPKKYNEY
jgi:protein-tyrosine phosphatase